MHTGGLRRNLGDLVVSVLDHGVGNPLSKPRPRDAALAIPRSERGAQARYRQAKETKCGGMGDQESEHSIVPAKRGNPPQGTPWREGGAGSWNRGRER